MTWRPCFDNGARPGSTRRGVEIHQMPPAPHRMLPSPDAMGNFLDLEGPNSGARPAEARSGWPRVAHGLLRSTGTGPEANRKPQFQRRRDSRSSLPPIAGHTHSARGTAKHQVRMQVPVLTEFAALGASRHRQLLCDKRHRSACAEVSRLSGRPRSMAESRRLLSSLRG